MEYVRKVVHLVLNWLVILVFVPLEVISLGHVYLHAWMGTIPGIEFVRLVNLHVGYALELLLIV